MKKDIEKKLSNITELIGNNSDYFTNKILEISELVSQRLKEDKTIFWAGNGGSAAECQHMSAELVGRFNLERKALKSISLTTDTSAITAIGNDYGYENIFKRQVEGLAKEKDIIFCLSTSGKSENIIELLKYAKINNLTSIAMLGKNGGESLDLADISVLVPSDETARIQEMHGIICHLICERIEQNLFS